MFNTSSNTKDILPIQSVSFTASHSESDFPTEQQIPIHQRKLQPTQKPQLLGEQIVENIALPPRTRPPYQKCYSTRIFRRTVPSAQEALNHPVSTLSPIRIQAF
uniref:Uncharacterized protein n=1 Tax=Cacopsylla melanoneura TaxID=428564 RepID=A0A8D8YRB4_9HEMI